MQCLRAERLVFIMGYLVAAGATGRLLFGYDSFGNVCGKKNSPVEGAPLSGQDMTLKKHVFFMNSCNLEVKDARLGSTVLCVSSCPEEQLHTLEEVQPFANTSGSFLCVYSLNSFHYTQNPNADLLCPRLPVPPSKSFPLFNRCIPQTPECYSLFASVLINDVDTLHRILSGIMFGRDTIIRFCVFILVVCRALWWQYYNHTNDRSTELDPERENMRRLLRFAVVFTVITAVVRVLISILRKRMKLTVKLLQVTSRAISNSPFLLLQPLWMFATLIFFWVLWVAVLPSLGNAGAAQVIGGGQAEHKPPSGIRYTWWYHLIGLIWTGKFLVACQQMTVAGAVVTCYFNRNKNDPPDRPILSSLSTLFCYHQGTVVKGSFLIMVVRIPRTILTYIYNTLKEKHSAWSRCVFRCCGCCFWCLDKCLCHLNQNAYTTTAINGTDFCTSAKDALRLLSKNSSHFTAVNCFGDFIIFLGKHSFLSVFETVLDALFLCFAVDLETNDGSSEKPFFMDREFWSFVKRINKLNTARAQRGKNSSSNREGTEHQLL